ncbi:MAG TPA: hypothetical protein VGF22_11715, partial [Acidimicrobiales bacterium]
MRNLVALALPGGPEFVVALRRAWDAGDAVVVLDHRLPANARTDVLDTLAVSQVVADDGTTAVPAGRRMDDGPRTPLDAPAPTGWRVWLAGARPRTLPAAIVPVLVGTACAVGRTDIV